MEILRSVSPLRADTAACLGAFDGLHRGHQALLRSAYAAGQSIAVITFERHPARVLAPEHAPPLLQSPTQRARVCHQLGIDQLVTLPFDRAMASRSASQFVSDVLAPLGLRTLIVGADFRFGRGRDGTASSLSHLAAAHGIHVIAIDPITATSESETKISSSSIRSHVAGGDLIDAAAQLGRWYSVEGRVQRGAGRGRGLGFPTANVSCHDALLPPDGVYAAAMAIVPDRGDLFELASPVHAAVVNLGPAPSFDDQHPADLEVHALDIDFGDRLYGATVEVWLGERLRDPQRFASPDDLRRTIDADIVAAREIIGDEPSRHAIARFDPPLESRS